MADHVCKPIRELVEKGALTPEQGIEMILKSAVNDTPDLRPDVTDGEFWSCLAYCAGRSFADVASVVLEIARVAAAIKRMLP